MYVCQSRKKLKSEGLRCLGDIANSNYKYISNRITYEIEKGSIKNDLDKIIRSRDILNHREENQVVNYVLLEKNVSGSPKRDIYYNTENRGVSNTKGAIEEYFKELYDDLDISVKNITNTPNFSKVVLKGKDSGNQKALFSSEVNCKIHVKDLDEVRNHRFYILCLENNKNRPQFEDDVFLIEIN